MRDFAKALGKHKTIGIDTSPFTFHLEKHSSYSRLTVRLFEEVEKGSLKAVTSTITLMEILVRPKQLRDREAIEDYKFALKTFPNLTLKAVDENVAEQAADMRANYELRPPDALQIATATSSNATAFVTSDGRLKRVQELETLVLKDFL